MPRPKKEKIIRRAPEPLFYMPAGWTSRNVMPAEIAVEDFEVMRLVDGAGLNLEEAARELECSKSTAGRMLERARRILAKAIMDKAPFAIDAGLHSNFSIGSQERFPAGQLAAAVESDSAEGRISGIFGRAPHFAIHDPVAGRFRFIQNPAQRKKRNAGKEAVRLLAEAGVRRVAAGRFGPEALQALAEAQIEPLLIRGLTFAQFTELYLQTTENESTET